MSAISPGNGVWVGFLWDEFWDEFWD